LTIKTILVTGSSGTIGTRLCEALVRLNYDVIGFDLRPNKWNPDVNKRTVIGDLTNTSNLASMTSAIDLVVHLAANARVYKLVLSPSLARDNITMIFTVLEFLRERRIRRFIFASSREVYGNAQRSGTGEDQVRIIDSESPYAASKMAGEALIHAMEYELTGRRSCRSRLCLIIL
jgi:UDP-glucose 4-epimerase